MAEDYVMAVLKEVRKAVVGKDEVLLWMLTAILARGHILLEDRPGTGKTTIALAFSRAMGLDYGRMQFTPDVLPSDITGYTMYQRESGKMVYQPGAIFCNLFLADELNRAVSRTQSALLEAMEEGHVTVDGREYALPSPFIVIATENPAGAAGTSLLPDSQIDRFMIRLSVGYPDRKAEMRMVRQRLEGNPLNKIKPVLGKDELLAVQNAIDQTYMKEEIIGYIVDLIEATRRDDHIRQGASPRATLALAAMAKAIAYTDHRDYVIPEDVSLGFEKVVSHRLMMDPSAEAEGHTVDEAVRTILNQVHAPKVR